LCADEPKWTISFLTFAPMDASVKKLLTDIPKKKFQPVYVLQGEEDYYIDRVANALEEHVVPEHDRSFNQVVLYGKDVTVATVLNNARRFPMMADRQLVLVREAQEISDLNKEQGAKLLLSYMLSPVPTTVLVLCHKHKSLDKRKELGKKVDSLGFMYSFAKPKQYQLPDFVSAHFSERGFQVEPNGIQALCEYVGTDLNRLVNEIDKLLIGKTKDKLITADYIMARVGISREYNIFELQKAVLSRDVPRVFQIVQYFQANTKRNPVIVTVAFFYSFFSKLLMAAYAKDKSPNGLVAELKISPYAAKDYAQSLGAFSPHQIQKAITLLKTADLKLKGVNSGSGEDEGQILQELMVSLMH
jgi:DNA polymerase-3 subunit delta